MVLVVVAVLLPVLNRAKMTNIEIWVLYVALCLTNFFIISNSGEIGNYSLSLLCVSAAVTAINAPGPASLAWLYRMSLCRPGDLGEALFRHSLLRRCFLFFLINDRSARDPSCRCVRARISTGLLPVLYFLARDYQSFWRWTIHFFQLILPLRLTGATDALCRIANMVMLFVALMVIPIGFFIAATVAGVAPRRCRIARTLRRALTARRRLRHGDFACICVRTIFWPAGLASVSLLRRPGIQRAIDTRSSI